MIDDPCCVRSSRIAFTLPATGWSAFDPVFVGKNVAGGGDTFDLYFSPFLVDNVYTGGCHWVGTALNPPVGPTVDDLATALLAQAGPGASPPVAVTVDGHPGKKVELSIPQDIDVTDVRFRWRCRPLRSVVGGRPIVRCRTVDIRQRAAQHGLHHRRRRHAPGDRHDVPAGNVRGGPRRTRSDHRVHPLRGSIGQPVPVSLIQTDQISEAPGGLGLPRGRHPCAHPRLPGGPAHRDRRRRCAGLPAGRRRRRRVDRRHGRPGRGGRCDGPSPDSQCGQGCGPAHWLPLRAGPRRRSRRHARCRRPARPGRDPALPRGIRGVPARAHRRPARLRLDAAGPAAVEHARRLGLLGGRRAARPG